MIEVSTSSTVKEVFEMIGDRMIPKQKGEAIEAFSKGKNISILTRTLNDYQIDSNCNFLISKRESFLENNNNANINNINIIASEFRNNSDSDIEYDSGSQ